MENPHSDLNWLQQALYSGEVHFCLGNWRTLSFYSNQPVFLPVLWGALDCADQTVAFFTAAFPLSYKTSEKPPVQAWAYAFDERPTAYISEQECLRRYGKHEDDGGFLIGFCKHCGWTDDCADVGVL